MEEKNILVLSKSGAVLKAISNFLNSMGYHAYCTKQFERGLEMAMDGNPDLIIMDCQSISENIGDLTHLKKYDMLKRIPVLLVIGRPDREGIEKAVSIGITEFIIKPLKRERFLHKIHTSLKIGRMKKQRYDTMRSQHIQVIYENELMTIIFDTASLGKGIALEIRTLFNPVFIKKAAHYEIILDLRKISMLGSQGARFIEKLAGLFRNTSVYLVAGRHYGTLALETDMDSSVPIFISFNDLMAYREQKTRQPISGGQTP